MQIPEAGAEGVLIAHGGRVGGYSFFVKDSRLHFVYNFLGRDFFTVVSNTEVPAGDVALRYEFEPTGEPDFAAGKGVPASGQLYIDGKLVGAVDMPHTVPNIFSTEGLTCGHDGGSRVAPDALPGRLRLHRHAQARDHRPLRRSHRRQRHRHEGRHGAPVTDSIRTLTGAAMTAQTGRSAHADGVFHDHSD